MSNMKLKLKAAQLDKFVLEPLQNNNNNNSKIKQNKTKTQYDIILTQ